MSIIRKLIQNNIDAPILLSDPRFSDWEIYSQEGPSDETMLVSKKASVGIIKDDLFGYSYFPLPLTHLEQCGWHKIGDL